MDEDKYYELDAKTHRLLFMCNGKDNMIFCSMDIYVNRYEGKVFSLKILK